MGLLLAGRRILVTRAAGQASRLAELLTDAGAEPILVPTIELAPPLSYCGLDAALTTIRSFDWLLFTSPNAVMAYTARARLLRLPAQAKRIAAIGAATAAVVLEEMGREVDLIPQRAVGEAFAEALLPLAPGSSMLLVRAAEAREILPETLAAAGAILTVAAAYRNVVPSASVEALRALLPDAPPDAVTFTSASTAFHLHELLEKADRLLPPGIVLASIGPATSQAMRELGWEPTAEAAQPSLAGLVDALSHAVAR